MDVNLIGAIAGVALAVLLISGPHILQAIGKWQDDGRRKKTRKALGEGQFAPKMDEDGNVWQRTLTEPPWKQK